MAVAPLAWNAQAQGFEGAMSMTMNVSGQTIPVDYKLKGHKARVDLEMGGRKNTVLIDLDAHTQTMLIPEFKAYLVHKGDSASPISSATPPKVTDMGTTETVAGHSCNDFKLESEKYQGTACMTKEFGESPLAESMTGQLGSALKGDDVLQKAGVPLKLDLTFKEGEKPGNKATMEVTSIAPGPVNAAEFEIPAGWQPMNNLPGAP